MKSLKRGTAQSVALILALGGLGAASSVQAQTVAAPAAGPAATAPRTSVAPAAPVAMPAAAPMVGPAPVAGAGIRIPEGTEVRISIDETLSSKTASAGDVFAFRTIEAIHLPDGTVLPEGYRGRGEVTDVEKKGMLGKAGQLNIRLNYLSIGGARVHLRQNAGVQGKSGVGATVALSLIVSPLFLMHHGAEAEIPKGRPMTAYVEEEAVISNPPPLPNAA